MRRGPKQTVATTAGSSLLVTVFTCIAAVFLATGMRGASARHQGAGESRQGQSREEADRKSAGCVSCHSPMDEPTMHPTRTVQLGCTDCHGGNSSASITAGTAQNSPEYATAKEKAHIQPRDPSFRNRG